MKILLWTTALIAALIIGILLGRSGVLDLTGCLVLMGGGSIGVVLLYPYVRKVK